MEAFIAGAWRSLVRAETYTSGQWKAVSRGEAYIGGGWRSLFSTALPMTLSVSPTQVSGYATPFKPVTQTITTDPVTATPSGGLGPYTYAWSGGNTPLSATNSFTRTLPGNTDAFDTFTVTVTDSLGSTATASVDAYFSNQSQI